ncbi:NADH-quinone oxidoreductase chain 3 [mine drainage metagenome]|uniref:NADH-quinone oxidoreductase chain 3 n=1 Tax=mine drainage metagenome TaxID=410659 RepID=A0A1J5QEA4_9ZZZZ
MQGWDSLAQLRRSLVQAVPHLGAIDVVAENPWAPLAVRAAGKADFRNAVKDFYLTNPIARASNLMAELSKMQAERRAPKMAAE